MNPVIMGSKLNLKRNELTDVKARLQELEKKREELESAVDGVENEEDLKALEADVDENDQQLEEARNQKAELEETIEEFERQLNELNNKKPTKGERRNMNTDMEVREGINAYVKSKGQTRDGFTSVEGGALIPEELLQPKMKPEDTVNLTNLISVRSVNSASGKYPVIKKSDGKMNTVEELAKNPELAKPVITEINYDIDTYRGYIPVSQEVIDDADYDVTGLIADEIANQELNTKNAAIADILKNATAKSKTGIDGLKELFNVDLKRVYQRKAVISASLYNELDTAKDNNGRYLLQDDITVASGKKLFGHEVVVLDDDVIGEKAGDLVGFFGDPKAFCTLFDRKRASVKWIDNDVYGQLLAGFVRFDVKEVDEDAGFYVTYTPEGESGN